MILRWHNPNIFFLVLVFVVLNATAQSIKVTLLGTGTLTPSLDRFGPSTLVEAGGQKLLFDCGRGASQRLWQLKIPLGQVNRLFLTHLHSDHTVGIPDVWLTGWTSPPFGRRTAPMRVWGPAGTKEMMGNLEKAFSWDIQTRRQERNKSDSGIILKASDIQQGIIYNEGGVIVTAFLVKHADFIKETFGYRVDFAGHAVVISGDTRYNENLIQVAKGADVLLHEVAATKEISTNGVPAHPSMSYHTSPEEAAKVFGQVRPKLAVYIHVILLSADQSKPSPTSEEVLQRTQEAYKGRVELGEDLMTIEIGEEVKASKPNHAVHTSENN